MPIPASSYYYMKAILANSFSHGKVLIRDFIHSTILRTHLNSSQVNAPLSCHAVICYSTNTLKGQAYNDDPLPSWLQPPVISLIQRNVIN